MKKYNNKSVYLKDWTTSKLKQEAKGYYQSIYEVECYGSSDLQIYDGILNELYFRGIEISSQLNFN